MQKRVSLKSPPSANRETPRRWLAKPLQCKLMIGAVDDPLEREADRIANRVVRGPGYNSLNATSTGSAVSRKCACGRSSDGTGECEECKKKREATVQRVATQANSSSV